MAPTSLRLCHRLSASPSTRHQPKLLASKFLSRSLTSATHRSSAHTSTRLSHHPNIQSSSNTVPNLCLGAGGKAPGFVQQMLFSAPVQEKNAKGNDRQKKIDVSH